MCREYGADWFVFSNQCSGMWDIGDGELIAVRAEQPLGQHGDVSRLEILPGIENQLAVFLTVFSDEVLLQKPQGRQYRETADIYVQPDQ